MPRKPAAAASTSVPADLCPEHFLDVPGLLEQGVTSVGCEHGTWSLDGVVAERPADVQGTTSEPVPAAEEPTPEPEPQVVLEPGTILDGEGVAYQGPAEAV